MNEWALLLAWITLCGFAAAKHYGFLERPLSNSNKEGNKEDEQ